MRGLLSPPSGGPQQLKQSILAPESQRAILAEAVVDLSIAILREKLAALNQSVVTQTEQVGEHHIIRRADLKTYQSNYLNQGEKMIRVTALYPRTNDTFFNMDYYLNKHVALIQARAKEIGINVGIQVDEGLGTITPDDPAPYVIVGFMNFEKIEDFQNLVATHGNELIGDIANFTNIPWQMQISNTVFSA